MSDSQREVNICFRLRDGRRQLSDESQERRCEGTEGFGAASRHVQRQAMVLALLILLIVPHQF